MMTLTGFVGMMVSFGLMVVFTVVHAGEEQDRSTSSPHSEDSHQPRCEQIRVGSLRTQPIHPARCDELH